MKGTTKMATTNAKIRTEIGKFVTSRDKLMEHGHNIAILVMQHAAPKAINGDCDGTGDTTTLLELAAAMPSSWAEQLYAWCVKFTPMRFNVSANNHGFDTKYKKLSAEEKLAAWDYEGAINTPFYKAMKERAPADPLDFSALVKMVEQLSKRIEKKVNDEEVRPEDVPTALAIAAKLKGMRITRVKPEPANEQEEAPTEKRA